MEITTRPAITVSERDLERLETMLAGLPDDQPGVDALREELDRAQITD
ncbi:MAG: transcription elongation factor GreAB, partial [Betaproteobacteria bacterium HGW-Betaproteobacteria-17]